MTMQKILYLFSLFALLIVGCGQQGPLYLPGDEPPIYVPPEERIYIPPEKRKPKTKKVEPKVIPKVEPK